MSNKDLYKAVFSQVHTSVRIDWEDFQVINRHMRPARVLAAVAAIAAVLCAMTATAFALNLFGLRDLAFPDRTTLHVPRVDPDTGDISWEERVVDIISMQGYKDTPENLASMEWNDFYWDYVSGRRFSNDPTGLDPKYDQYSVYDQVMADKLDEIVAKYGLKLHRNMSDVPGREAWLELLGPAFLAKGNAGGWGYRYDDGTCAFDGEAALADYGVIDYQFHYARKGYLDTVVLNVGNLSDYTEWDYTTANGVQLMLSIGLNRSFIWADLPEGFVFVNVLTGSAGDDTFSSGPITSAELEALADMFDFTALG